MGLLDYTRLLNRLDPKPDGEAPVRHRSAVVDAVNSDGTVDIIISGIVVPGVSVLADAAVGVGQTVQVVSWGGDLLVLGATRTAGLVAEVVSGTAASLTLTVPDGVTAARVTGVMRTNAAVVRTGLFVAVNGFSGTNVYRTLLVVHVGGSAAPSVTFDANDNRWSLSSIVPGTSAAAASIFGSVDMMFPNVAAGVPVKMIQWTAGQISTTTAADALVSTGHGRVATTLAISTIELSLASGSFVAGTRFDLVPT